MKKIKINSRDKITDKTLQERYVGESGVGSLFNSPLLLLVKRYGLGSC
jgi:hypothetical protein